MGSGRLADLTTSFVTIASTLIVLKVQLPYNADLESLAERWPMFLSGIDSFMIVLLLWYNHVREIRKLNFISFPVLFLSTFWVLFLLLVPYATGWVMDYPYRPIPHAVYLSIMGLCFLIFELILLRLVSEKAMTKEYYIRNSKLRMPMYILNLIGIAVIWIWPVSGFFFVVAIVLYNTGYLFYITRSERSHP